MGVLRWCAHGSFALSGLFLLLGVAAKLGVVGLGGFSAQAFYAGALIFGVYSIAFSMCGGRDAGRAG